MVIRAAVIFPILYPVTGFGMGGDDCMPCVLASYAGNETVQKRE